MDPQVIVDRLMRFLRLDTSVFEDMRDDPNGLIPALIVVAVSFLISGIGGWLWWVISDYGDKTKALLESALLGTAVATALWVAWVAVAYFILVSVFHYSTDIQRMIRSCGFAAVPAALMIFMPIPGINLGVGIAAFGLMFLLMD